MKPDLYTKAVLTVIALLLAVVAFRPLIQPQTIVQAQGASGVQFAATGSQIYGYLYDPRTNSVKVYTLNNAAPGVMQAQITLK